MRQLLEGQFDPLTFNWGFVESDLGEIASEWTAWLSEIRQKHIATKVGGNLALLLSSLEPLTMPVTRELLVSTMGGWTAYFSNAARGIDASPRVSYMAQRLKCRGVAVTCIPDIPQDIARGRGPLYGSVQFQLFGPERREFLNYERSIWATNDGGRWQFGSSGEIQPFEQVERYTARRIVDRLTSEMLAEYCEALGIRLFDQSFYGPAATVIELLGTAVDPSQTFSLAQSRKTIGLDTQHHAH
jgi:hypothetical protein